MLPGLRSPGALRLDQKEGGCGGCNESFCRHASARGIMSNGVEAPEPEPRTQFPVAGVVFIRIHVRLCFARGAAGVVEPQWQSKGKEQAAPSKGESGQAPRQLKLRSAWLPAMGRGVGKD